MYRDAQGQLDESVWRACFKLTVPQSSHATAVEQMLGPHLISGCQEAFLLCLQYSPEPADAGILLGCRVQLGASGQENEQGSVEVAAQHAVSQPPGQQGTVLPSTHAHQTPPADLLACTSICSEGYRLQSGRQLVSRQLLRLPC